MTTPLDRLKTQAARQLREGASLEGEERTTAYRATAETLVDARTEHFYTADGTPDYSGRSYAYRRFVGDVYSEAGIPREDLATTQSALRYHIGNVLRDRLSPDELEALGLRTVSPRDRSVEKRATQSRLLAQVSGQPVETPEEALAAIETVDRLLRRLDGDVLRALNAESRKAVRELLDDAEGAIDELAKAAGRRRRVTK